MQRAALPPTVSPDTRAQTRSAELPLHQPPYGARRCHHSRPRLPLTVVFAVCLARALPDGLASTISGFLTLKYWTIEMASGQGDFELLQRLIALEPSNMHPLYQSHIFSQALVHAVKQDNAIELVKCLSAYCPSGFAGYGMTEAASLSKAEVLEWLAMNHPTVVWSPTYANSAAERGHLNVLQWLKKHSPDPDRDLAGAIIAATKNGRLVTIKWLHENTTRASSPTQESGLGADDLHALKYLLEHGYKHLGFSDPIDTTVATLWNPELTGWLQETFYFAVECGEHEGVHGSGERLLRIVQLLRGLLIPGDYDEETFPCAAENGRLDVMQWLFPTLHSDSRDPYMAEYTTILEAAANGHFEVLQWLYEHRTEKTTWYDFADLISNGRLEILKWLVARSTAVDSTHALDAAAANGHLDMLTWLQQNFLTACSTNAMDDAAANNHLQVIKWLHEYRTEGCTTDAMDYAGSIERSGDFDVLLFLHANRSEGCAVQAGASAHFEGRTVILHWLVDNYPNVMKPENVDDEEDKDFKAFLLENADRVKRRRVN